MTKSELIATFARFTHDPSRMGKAMRDALRGDQKVFLDAVLGVPSPSVSDRGIRYALTLLRGGDLAVKAVADPAVSTLHQSRALTRCMLALDAAFLSQLVERTFVNQGIQNVASALRVLDLVAEYPEDVANWRIIGRLCENADLRVRSKSAALMARFRYNEDTAASRFDDGEARVRAGIVEALWNGDHAKGTRLMERALDDTDNRVAGNACLALYEAGDSRALTRIASLMDSGQPPFQLTAAWVMGRTSDIRFTPHLTTAASAGSQDLRKAATKALTALNPMRDVPAWHLQPLLASIVVQREKCEVWTRVVSERGEFVRGVSSLDFFLYSSDRPILDYSVSEVTAGTAVAIRIVFPASSPALAVALLQQAQRKPRSDRWAVSAYGPSVATHRQLLESEFIQDPAAVTALFRVGAPSTRSAARSIRSLLRLPDQPMPEHLILFLSGPDAVDLDLAALRAECMERDVQLHCWRSPDVAGKSSGEPYPVVDEADFAAAWNNLAQSFHARYSIQIDPRHLPVQLTLRDTASTPPTFSRPYRIPGSAPCPFAAPTAEEAAA